jgi:dTDP-4-amino-4,6-dideoxygalactose transaminase
VPGLEVPYDDEAVERGSHFAFVVLLRDRGARDAFRGALRERGVQTTWYPALHELTAYRRPASELARAAEAADRHCALPMSPSLSAEKLDAVTDAVRAAVSG